MIERERHFCVKVDAAGLGGSDARMSGAISTKAYAEENEQHSAILEKTPYTTELCKHGCGIGMQGCLNDA